MARDIAAVRPLVLAQAGVRSDLRAMFKRMSSDIAGMVTSSAGLDGKPNTRTIQTQAGTIVSRYFVGYDGRHPFGTDGITAQAAYPDILNKWIARSSQLAVISSARWMKRVIPEDVYTYLKGAKRNARAELAKEITASEFYSRYSKFRIWQTNPLAKYDPSHTWVDPSGYQLSDRIWQASQRIRQKIDAMLADGIRQGLSATELAKRVEPYLLPGRLGVRTDKPYGRDASYDAMRLARTEISRAHAQATYAAALANPYVDGMDWALSLAHPKIDVCDDLATIGMTGERLREPYPLHAAVIPPAHPHCLCTARQAVSEDIGTVTAELRQAIEDARQLEIDAYVSPANVGEFLVELLGAQLFSYLVKDFAEDL